MVKQPYKGAQGDIVSQITVNQSIFYWAITDCKSANNKRQPIYDDLTLPPRPLYFTYSTCGNALTYKNKEKLVILQSIGI